MPESLNITCGSSTDKGLKAYKEFVDICTFGGANPDMDLLNIPEEKEKIFLRMRKDISSDNCAVFDKDGLTCILFEFTDEVKLDMGKLAMWRLATHSNMGGTWLTDFVDNRLGGYDKIQSNEATKPNCALIGQDGNIFNLMGIASNVLKENGMYNQSEEMIKRITSGAQNYYEALNIIGEYVNITSVDDIAESEGMEMRYE